MDSSDVIQLLILLILLLLSAFFSSSETALTTVNKIRMRNLAEDGDGRAQTVLKIVENPGKMLSAILIGEQYRETCPLPPWRPPWPSGSAAISWWVLRPVF